jgi:hypothetical protein
MEYLACILLAIDNVHITLCSNYVNEFLNV